MMREYAYLSSGNWIAVTAPFELDEINYPSDWLALATDAERAAIGVYPIVEPDAPPSGHRVIGSRLEDHDGLPVRVLETEAIPDAEVRQGRRREVDQRIEQAFGLGYPPAHPAFVGERLQVRGNEDRTNWLTSQASYSAAVAGGHGDVIGATFRTMGNATITVSYAEGLHILLGMAAWGQTIMARSWALKDAIEAGEPIDIDAGWPE
ncbi:DUF4376 domain-containing protein [Sphingomonas sp. AX6]|uniref:DUF4376 domain-containing protein n=1 Tax=Sphingomonas sp. AX6 TaxID=2653171 RepID=UPI0012F3701E|nr:hypothetical protein [Sphingomonas sp. AX6]VXC63794.1 hypothetical protein SPHINGOAX6_30229 [Sphingomonas sp. AX6]